MDSSALTVVMVNDSQRSTVNARNNVISITFSYQIKAALFISDQFFFFQGERANA